MKNKPESNEVIQWGYDFIQSYYLNNRETQTHEERMYLHYLAPFSDKYFSTLNPFVIFGGADPAQLMKKDTWMFRDGLIPLSFFFNEASLDLISSNRTFLVHKDFWFLVPTKWQKNVLFYDIAAKNIYDKKNKPKKIVLAGLANDTLSDPLEFEQSIKALASVYSKKDLEKIEVSAYFPNKRTDLWGRWQDENIFQYAKVLFENLKLDIDFPEWDIFKSNMDYSDTLYYEVNSGVMIKDSYVQHLFLSRGAGLLKNEDKQEHFSLVNTHPLSLYHDVQVFKCNFAKLSSYQNPLDSHLMPYYKKIIEKGATPRTISDTWEKWYGTYVKKHYKGQGLI